MAIQLCEGDKGLQDLRIAFHKDGFAIEHLDEQVRNKRRHNFMYWHVNGWIVLQTLKNFVPADFIKDGRDKQRVKEGWYAIRILSDEIKSLANVDHNPETAKIFWEWEWIKRDEWMVAIHPQLDNKFKALRGMQNTNVADYYNALEMFENLVFDSFKSDERQEYWDNFLKQILDGDVAEVHDIEFDHYQRITAQRKAEEEKMQEKKPTEEKVVPAEEKNDKVSQIVKHEAKPVSYAGYNFRSTLEAKWAAFFDACGVAWRYEPKEFRIDGYQIDFVVDEVKLYHGLYSADKIGVGDFFFEVKGQAERAKTLEKTKRLIGEQLGRDYYYLKTKPTLVLYNIPFGGTMDLLMDDAKRLRERWINESKQYWPDGDIFPYTSTTFTMDDVCAIPCVSTKGELMIGYCGCMDHIDVERTIAAYGIAWNAKFGADGLTPDIVRQMMRKKTSNAKPKIILDTKPKERYELSFPDGVPQKYALAMEKIVRMMPTTCSMLSKAIFGGFDGSTVTLLFDGTGRMIRPLLERNTAQMEQVFSEAFGTPVKVRMLDAVNGTTTQTTQAARRVIEQSYDVLGRDKIELIE